MASDNRQHVLRVLSRATLVFVATALTVRPLTSGQIEGLEITTLLQLFPLYATLFLVFRMVLMREVQVIRAGLGLPLGILIACFFLSVLRASCKFPAVSTAFEWLADILLFWLAVQMGTEGEARKTLERVFLATALVIALYGLHQHIRGFPEMTEWIEKHTGEARAMLGLDDINWEDFKSRLGTYEVFSTFVIPNALAGYFLLVLPVLAAGLLLERQQGLAGFLSVAFRVFMLVAVLLCMAWTGAKGAWACLPAEALVFVLLLGDQISRRARVCLAAAIVGLVLAAAALLVAVPRFKGYGLGLWDSLEIRFGYWETAWEMVTDNWGNLLWGIGLANFQEAYPYYKTLGASEVQKAHNHYIQLLAEIGLLGLLSFVATWGLCYFRCLRGPLRDEGGQGREGSWLDAVAPLVGGALGFITLVFFAQPFKNLPSSTDHLLITLALFGVWCAFVLVESVKAQGPEGRREAVFRRAGYLAAIAGILLHSVIDFDLSVAGNSQSLWLLAGLALALNVPRPAKPLPLSPMGQVGLTVAGLLVFLFLTSYVLPKIANSEASKREAKHWIGQALQGESRPKPEPLQAAIGCLRQAAQENPHDPETYFELGIASQYFWLISMDGAAAEEGYASFRRAVELAPLRGTYHLRFGQFLELMADRPPAFFKPQVLPSYRVPPSEAEEKVALFKPALAEYAQAARLYPTKPVSHMPLADLLWKLGYEYKEEAGNRYRTILDMDDRIHPRWRNLRLPKADRERALERAR